jgi:hypothetical protein
MVRRWLRFAGLTLLLGFAVVPAAHADTRWSVNSGIGGPRVGVAAVPYGYVCAPGRYVWTGYDYRWVEGRWVPPLYGRRVPYAYRYRGDRRWDTRAGWRFDRERDWRDRRREDERRGWRR